VSENSKPASLPEILSDKVVAHIWKRMISIYGHKWASHLGSTASNDDGTLTDAAKTWRAGMAGITIDQLRHGFEALILKNHDWPPSLPEFRKLCQAKLREIVPSLEEMVTILALASSRQGSLAKRYRHPLALAISQHEGIDVFALRTAKTDEAKRMVRPVYEKMLETGWSGWPEHAFEEQKAVSHQPVVNRAAGLAAVAAMRQALNSPVGG
jgi:hypothetical protein